VAVIREALAGRVLIADGAMGTMLQARGFPFSRCYEELNLAAPEMIREIHGAYVAAGADVIETNTFGANRARLATFGLEGKVAEINRAAVHLAREAAGALVFVAGAVGPAGTASEEIFREQIDVLLEAGVDLLIFETFVMPGELEQAVLAARKSGGDDLFVVAQTVTGYIPEGLPADLIGCNCGTGPEAAIATIQNMARWSRKPLSTMPSAGLPGGYLSPEAFAAYAPRFVAAGVRLLGGCCGTTPEHVRCLRAMIV
jgi:methionine synthase I (cobalamin-dependent)